MITSDVPQCDQKQRFQFRLRTVLLLMTAAAILLALGRRMPIELLEMIAALLTVSVGTAILFLVIWCLHKYLTLTDTTRPVPIKSMLLTSMSGTIFILAHLPLSSLSMFLFYLREVTICTLLFIIPTICSLTGSSEQGRKTQPRYGWLVIGISSYLCAWYVVITHGFFPRV